MSANAILELHRILLARRAKPSGTGRGADAGKKPPGPSAGGAGTKRKGAGTKRKGAGTGGRAGKRG